MREASTSDWSCASRSAAARLAGCRIARRPALGFCCCWALSDAGWSRFPHGTHSSRLCAGFRHRFAAADKSQRRPLTPRAAKGFGEKNCLGALAADIVRGGQEQAGLESAADLEAVVIGVAYRLGLGAGGEISRATVAVT